MGGVVGDLVSSPTNPLPSADDASPYTLGCLKGVPFTWSVLAGSSNGAQCASNGTSSVYSPIAVDSITEVFEFVPPTPSPVTAQPTASPVMAQPTTEPTIVPSMEPTQEGEPGH